MAFADTQSVTVGSSTVSLANTGRGMSESRWGSSDGKYLLTIRHSYGARTRHLAQLQLKDIVSNPLVPANNMALSTHAHIVIDAPVNGLSSTEVAEIADAIVAWATPANIAKLVAGE